eukprot:1136801-Pelagomonas_calceolata.AAC.1
MLFAVPAGREAQGSKRMCCVQYLALWDTLLKCCVVLEICCAMPAGREVGLKAHTLCTIPNMLCAVPAGREGREREHACCVPYLNTLLECCVPCLQDGRLGSKHAGIAPK